MPQPRVITILEIDKVKPDLARCAFCGYEGLYRVEVVDTDYRDRTDHDSIVTGCKDIEACFERGGNNHA